MDSVPQPSRLSRIDEIEGIRGVLSVTVVLGHINLNHLPWFWGCMEIFFAISGYLIGRIAIVHRHSPGFWRTYLARRVLRIWPLYYLVLTYCVGDAVLRHYLSEGATPMPRLAMIRDLFFLQNTEFLLQPFGEVNAVTQQYLANFLPSWSVALEEQFYLLAPFLAWAIFARLSRIKGEWAQSFSFCVLTILMLSALLRLAGMNWWVLPGRLDPFLLGLLLAVLELRSAQDANLKALMDRAVLPAFLIIAAATLLFVMSYYWPTRYLLTENNDFGYELRHVLGVSLFAMFGFSLVAVCAFRKFDSLRRILLLQPLQYLGRISYSTYLWHVPMLSLLRRFDWYEHGVPAGSHAPVALAIILGISAFSFRFVETPAMNMKQRFQLDGKPTDRRENAPVPSAP